MGTHTKLWTEEELMALPKAGRKYELIEGELKLSPAGGWGHGDITLLLATELTAHVRRNKLGCTFDGQTGWWMKSGNLRSPDISFLAKARYAGKARNDGFMHGSPDLAVEVLSPSERLSGMDEKISEYFANDTKLAWVIDAKAKTVDVYSGPSQKATLRVGDILSGDNVVPGFNIAISDLFATD